MDTVIKELQEMFDIILFDTPPVLAVTDTSILASKIDAIVLCYEIGRTAKGALLRAKSQLEGVGGKVVGIVLNHIKPETEVFYAYPYQYRYYGKEGGVEST